MTTFSENQAGKRTYLFGEGFCKILVNYTYRKLLLKRIYGVDLDGVEISIASDQLPHTLITFSQSGENKNGLIKIAGCKKMEAISLPSLLHRTALMPTLATLPLS
ncbi:hypothetical protein SDC49_08885 [Lactobacillus sp. R2/2]|nr:hypothetical protein [Lactobacillus sp. R2/2]